MPSTEEVLDRDALFSMAMNDHATLARLVELFEDLYPAMLDDIRDAIYDNDAQRLNETAHRMKGAVSTFHARAARQTAGELERVAKAGTLDDAPLLFRHVAEQVLALVDQLHDLTDELRDA